MEAKDNRSADNLVRRMTTPPFDPLAEQEVKPGSYEKLNEIAEDIWGEGQESKDKWARRGPDLWDSIGKKP